MPGCFIMTKDKLDIIFEDNHLLVVNKDPGMLVQGDKTGDINLVDAGKEYIRKKYNKPGNVFLGLVHRLDRPVSGLVILARTSKALERMNAQFREKSMEKIYWAITEKVPENLEGRLVHWLTKDRNKNIVKASVKERKGSVKAELSYRTISHISQYFLLEINLHTGRFHQIRAQLAYFDCPVKGDIKYGSPKPLPDGSIALHARQLTFLHPVKKEKMVLRADLPDNDIWKVFN